MYGSPHTPAAGQHWRQTAPQTPPRPAPAARSGPWEAPRVTGECNARKQRTGEVAGQLAGNS